jgi:protein-L-isoaspartate(D-aspartate) O-methyltransferase
MNIEQARFNMIEQQIRSWEVLDPEVIERLSVVKRERFVPARYSNLAFAETQIPLGHGAHMLAPVIEARMAQGLNLKQSDRVLEIGTGSGYFAALLAARAAQVHSIEIVPVLAEFARQNLAAADVTNVTVETGDGLKPAAQTGDYDVIVLSGAVTLVPPHLAARLKPGGRLLAIVGTAPSMEVQLIERSGESVFTVTQLFETVVPMLINGQQASAFSF